MEINPYNPSILRVQEIDTHDLVIGEILSKDDIILAFEEFTTKANLNIDILL